MKILYGFENVIKSVFINHGQLAIYPNVEVEVEVMQWCSIVIIHVTMISCVCAI